MSVAARASANQRPSRSTSLLLQKDYDKQATPYKARCARLAGVTSFWRRSCLLCIVTWHRLRREQKRAALTVTKAHLIRLTFPDRKLRPGTDRFTRLTAWCPRFTASFCQPRGELHILRTVSMGQGLALRQLHTATCEYRSLLLLMRF